VTYDYDDFSVLTGTVLSKIEYNGSDRIVWTTSTGVEYVMYHSQNCCESVYVEDINGDLNDLLNTPILYAHESTSNDASYFKEGDYTPESFTWTFYNIGTIKGTISIRWLGQSNGYYSEHVTFCKRKDADYGDP
jgi:hypothetical protein